MTAHNYKNKLFFFVFFLYAVNVELTSQVNIDVEVYQVSTSIGDCDGFLGGDSDPAWWWTGGDIDNQCLEVTCNGCTIATNQSLLNESYECPNDMPNSISAVFHGCENDGVSCTLGAFPGICDGNQAQTTNNITLPTTNGTTFVGPFCANSSGCSGQWCYWLRLVRTGSFISQGNDFICDAIDLGTLNLGGTIGNESNYIYNNYCATSTGDLATTDWDNEQGVWFSFQTGIQVGTNIQFEFEQELADPIDLEVSIYSSNNGTCVGTFDEVATGVDGVDILFDESVGFECPRANTTYYILVDGYSNPLDVLDLIDEEHGYFGIGIYDDGIVAAADYICDAEDLGIPTSGGVTTSAPLQSNICGSQAISATANDPLPGTNWSTDPLEQQGVWFQFTAPTSGSVSIEIESTADIADELNPLTDNEQLSVQVALYGTSDGTCTGTLEFVDEQESDVLPCGLIPNDLYDEDFNVRCLIPGDTYWIFVDGDPATLLLGDGVEGYFSIVVTDLQQPPAPNDDICYATFLGAPLPGSPITLTDQSNLCASNFVEVNNFGWSNESGVWFSFIAPPSGVVEIWGENQFLYNCVIPVYEDAIQIELAVFEDLGIVCCGGGGDPVCNQNDEHVGLIIAENELVNDVIDGGIDVLDAANDEYMFVECLTPGETYYILVDGYPFIEVLGINVFDTDLIQGVFDITIAAVDQTAPTGNDLPCDAIALGNPTGGSVGGGTIYNNYCATVTGEPDVIAFDTTQTVWFEFIAPSTGSVNVDVNENGDDINLQIAVFVSSTGDCTGTLNEIASNDNELGWDVEIDEIHCLTVGETYYLMVDGEPEFTDLLGWEEGEFTVQINEIPTLPNLSLNNFICDGYDLGDPFTGGVGTTLILTDENNLCANNLNDPTPSCFDTDYTVWYEFTTPANLGQVAVEIFVESDYWSISNPFDFSFDAIDPQVAVFVSDPNDCTGVLSEVACGYTFDVNIFDAPEETVLVECLEPSTTYYVMVDGATTFAGDIGFGQGNFDISITTVNTNPTATNNDVCEFIDLGQVPQGGSIPPNTDFYNFCADVEVGEPAPFGLDQTVWFTFTAPNAAGVNASSGVTINAYSDPNNIGDEINLQLAAYESDTDCTGSLTLLDYEFDGILYGEDLELTCLVPGQEYYIQVDGADNLIGGIEGYFALEIIDDGAGMFPTNDDVCATAYPLGTVPNGGALNSGTTFSNLCATIEVGEPDPGFGLGTDDIDQTVWFTFSPPASGNVLIDADSDGSDNVDLQLAVYYSSNGTCDPTTFVPINHEWDGAGLAWDEDLLVTCLDPSVTYYLQVDGSSISEDLQGGNFTLELNDDGGSTTVPYNNDICDAHDFGVVDNTAGLTNETNECADIEPGEPGIFGFAQHTVWYQFTASGSGRIEIVIDPSSILNLLPEVHLYSSSTGDCTGTMTEIDSDIVPNLNIDAVIETSCIVPGETYFIQVDGQLLAPQGLFDITLINPEPNYGTGGPGDVEPSNNECINAIPIAVQDESCFIGDGIFQTENYGEPTISLYDAYAQSCNGNGNCGDTWYCFIMPPSGAALIEGNDDNGLLFDNDLTMIAYTGDCNGLTPISCGSDDEVSFEVGAAPGTKVYLQIFDGGLDYPNEDYQICISEQCGADNCLNAIVMDPNVPYCWDTSSALGENLNNGTPGYAECATGTGGDASPEHSVYFSFTSDCNGGSITLSIFDVIYDDLDPNYQPCGTFNSSIDGFTVSIFADATPCDNNYDDVLWCNVVDGCAEAIGPDSYEETFDNLNANTNYIIMIDGGVTSLLGNEIGGNVEGQIMITTLTSPEIDSMIVVDSIACYEETGTLTAEVSGGVYPYTYNWTDSLGMNIGTDSIYTPALHGWNYVTVTSDNGCEKVDSIYLPEPPELLSDVNFDPSTVCYGESVVAGVTASGGTPNYNYLWSNGETLADPMMLELGNTYTVTITDDNGCTTTEEIIVPLIEVKFIRN